MKTNKGGTLRFLRHVLLATHDVQAGRELQNVINKIERNQLVPIQRVDLAAPGLVTHVTDLENDNWRMHIKNFNAEQSAAGWRLNFLLTLSVLSALISWIILF